MARKITGGLTGSSTLVGTVQISPDAVLSTAADQNITISPGGTGNIVMSPAGAGQVTSTAHIQLNTQRGLRWADADSSHYVAFQAPATVTNNLTFTLPATDGSASQALVTNGAGVLSFAAAGASLSDNTTDSATNYLTFTTSTSGNLTAARVASTKLTFQPSTGTLTVTNLTETSSIALKENFSPIENALEKLLQLSGWIYDRKDGTAKGEAGLIAEHVNKIIPNVVTKDAQGNPETIAYTRLTAYLIEAVKSLKQEIDQLKGIK